MKLQITIEHSELGIVDVVTSPADMKRWEQLTKQKLTDLTKVIQTESGRDVMFSIGVEDMLAMAWAYCTRKQLITDAFAPFVEKVDGIEFEGIVEVNPTPPAVSDEL